MPEAGESIRAADQGVRTRSTPQPAKRPAFIANLELGYLHPPVGINLFLSAYRFKKPLGTIIWATLPFLLILAASVLLITYVPWLTTAPVRWLGK